MNAEQIERRRVAALDGMGFARGRASGGGGVRMMEERDLRRFHDEQSRKGAGEPERSKPRAVLFSELWREQAACRGKTAQFFPVEASGRRDGYAAARAICARCPVVSPCLDEAIREETAWLRFGMRGGMDPKQRNLEAIRRRRGAK